MQDKDLVVSIFVSLATLVSCGDYTETLAMCGVIMLFMSCSN